MPEPLDLSDVPFVDAHLHPPYRETPTQPAGWRWPWYEGSPDETALVPELVAYRAGIGELARHLGSAPEEEAVREAIAARDPLGWLREVVAAAGVTGLVVDTGYPPPETALDAPEVRDAAGVPVAALLRIEERAGELAAETPSFAIFLERFDAAVAGARDEGFAGLKTVIAYRSGLAVGRAPAHEAAPAFARERARAAGSARLRLTEKALLDHLLLRTLSLARAEELSLQVHAGYGDRDLDLGLSNPEHLRPLLESGAADGVPLVLLHGSYPYQAQAAILAATHPAVYVDVGTCIPPLGFAAQLDVWRTVLAVAPLSRIHASSDAAGLAEQIALGAWWARRGLAAALGELVAVGALRPGEAEEVAHTILAKTPERLYFA